ncbi:hypothetical protein Vretifemale_803 [Volvox reticuliferus]|uniref:Uncharacterized protein n=1 Tax=Volvox reticuliferus TaxID=1737510 RepID=A0A8J4BUT2_9CHLO|nr:hypothetical protein Vretifemale_803 [Volvox reticuliferus]
MCFKPKDVPSKKVVLVELERAKVILEQENSSLKVKLKDLQASTTRAAKERDGLICQRAELESQLQQRTSHASHLLTHITCLRTNLTSKLQELLDQHLVGTAQAAEDKRPAPEVATATKVNVHVAPPEDTDDVELCDSHESATGDVGRTLKANGSTLTQLCPMGPSGLPPLEIADGMNADQTGVPLSVQQQLECELEALSRTHQRVIHQAMQLCEYLRQADSDKAELRADVAGVRRRLEQAEANAADQQQVLQLRCAALEQENEQLTGMNQELQERLEGAQGDLSAAKKQWSSDGAQLAKQAAELQATSVRLRETEAELRVLQSQLAAATAQAEDANATVLELQEEVAVRASSLHATGFTLATRETELAAVTARLQGLQTQLVEQQQAREALAAELTQVKESEKLAADALNDARSQLSDARQELAAAQRDLAATQRDLAAARRDLEVQSQALLDSNTHLQESRTALADTGARLSRALEDVAASEARVTEANTQYLSTKQSVISTAKQLASMAKDHSANLAKLHALEAEATSLRDQLVAARSAEAALRTQVDSNGTAARESREAAEAAGEEVRRLRAAYDTASADLRRKIMLLTAIARMADKGQAGAGGGRSRDGQAADPADGYGAVTSEQRLRLKICESPLPLLGALTAGIMDSSRLRHLALDMDTSREVTWEKAGLRICCLAAAIGLNNSLQTLQLGGWTWGELGNGTALPFLALGGGGGGGVAGGMLRSVQLATNLFDLEAAAMLKDLLAAGLVELAAGPDGIEDQGGGQRTSNSGGGGSGSGSGQGVLYLYSGNERLDGWYREMLLLAGRRPQGRISGSGGGGGSAGVGSNGNVLAAIPAPVPRSSGPSSSGSSRSSAPFTISLSATSAALSVASSNPDGEVRINLSTGAAATAASNGAAATAAATAATSVTAIVATATAAVDCDLSSEALESHHMILVMTVLLTCPGMKRLRLDGNKLGDGGAALLALGLSTNTGLRELYLSRNGIRAAGARSLARCLEGANSTLLRLDLSGQRLEGIGAAGAEAIAQALRTNRTLEDLNLSSCGLSGSAAACFAGAIRAAGAVRPQSPSSNGGAPPLPLSSSSLTTTGGSISPRGGVSSGGGCLRRLILAGNGIDAATMKTLMTAAAERPGLALAL